MDTPSPSSNPPASSTFFRLPVELRLQIYGYLLPDIPYVPARLPPTPDCEGDLMAWARIQRHSWGWAMKQDQSKCHMSILRANKMINTEASKVLYDTVALEILVTIHDCQFLRQKGAHNRFNSDSDGDQELRRALRRFAKFRIALVPTAKELSWDVREPLYSGSKDDLNGIRRLKTSMNWIGRELLARNSQPSSRVKGLTIVFLERDVDSIAHGNSLGWGLEPFMKDPFEMQDRLKWFLAPFRNLRQLQHAEIQVDNTRIPRGHELSAKGPEDIIHPIFEDISLELCGNSPAHEHEPLDFVWQNLEA